MNITNSEFQSASLQYSLVYTYKKEYRANTMVYVGYLVII